MIYLFNTSITPFEIRENRIYTNLDVIVLIIADCEKNAQGKHCTKDGKDEKLWTKS